uniref:helix-turn-helix domain-containing protein n=1 Tax=Tabrizicola sp. TaxID=2005166 RepID=UPI00286C0EC9
MIDAIVLADGMSMIPLESDLMRAFLAVADTGSVTAAAGRVGRTQSAVSMQIRRLEENLGQPLFT